MAANNYLTQERTVVKKGIMELNTLDGVLTQNKALSQQIANLAK